MINTGMVVGKEVIALVNQSDIWWQVATNFSFNKCKLMDKF